MNPQIEDSTLENLIDGGKKNQLVNYKIKFANISVD